METTRAGLLEEISRLRKKNEGLEREVTSLTNAGCVILDTLSRLKQHYNESMSSIPMRLNCPKCGELHLDEGEFAVKVHHTHACQICGMVWRPAVVPTVGVRFLPGFKNDPAI